ncbi:FAD-dependent monooxygenase [Microlunatus soli]|uniref:2-polyprenyl-6-methoxyphenol hydroxylase n=1 Tax=Microlunatus soli TaxID=630515 RepID=A0A1H1Z2J7_9ACTN|nr:FAD-dependent monooxygenase [Microlunatus soli]SDT27823.1 2-polyprenyl-6-methoxyphenol hydroxylase [Microlunatus soli]
MTSVQNNANRTVLISGASIAGPALAYWLHRYGFRVTVVEKADAPRAGGYPIDVRGTAIEVVRRMGILPRLQDVDIASRQFTFLQADGSEVVVANPAAVAGSAAGQDLEVRRGDLTDALYSTVRDEVEFLFEDSIDTLDQSDDEVRITFRSGSRRIFDLVVGADGMHSRTRSSVFGPEERFDRYLGYRFVVFTMPNILQLSHELMMWNTPGRAAALYATGGHSDAVHAFLNFHQPQQPRGRWKDPAAQRELAAGIFADAGWEVPRIITAMNEADDLFADSVGQIRMPNWSHGRVSLVGDAAFAPSFLTGQGSSLALVGAYMLAHALATNSDHTAAFARYETGTREFVAMNQALVDTGEATLFPTTQQALEQRNARLRTITSMPHSTIRPAHSALTLPEPLDR